MSRPRGDADSAGVAERSRPWTALASGAEEELAVEKVTTVAMETRTKTMSGVTNERGDMVWLSGPDGRRRDPFSGVAGLHARRITPDRG